MQRKLILLVGLLCSLPAGAVSDQERWLQAQALTQQQDFAGAAQQYQALQHKTATAWYNLANCVYQLKDALSALVLWRRAQMQELRTLGYTGPVYRAAAQNILYTQARVATSNYQFDVTRAKAFGIGALTPVGTRQQLASYSNDSQSAHSQPAAVSEQLFKHAASDQQSDVGTRQRANGHSLADNGPGATASGPNLSSESNLRLSADNFVTQKLAYLVALYHSGLAWITKISQQTPLIFLQLILLILWFSLSWVLYRVYINFKFTRKLFNSRLVIKFMGVLILSLLVVLTAQLLYRKQQFNQTNWGVVIKPTQLYLGPGTDYPLTAQLTAATYVKILAEKRQSWYAVQTEDRQLNGWITASDLVLC